MSYTIRKDCTAADLAEAIHTQTDLHCRRDAIDLCILSICLSMPVPIAASYLVGCHEQSFVNSNVELMRPRSRRARDVARAQLAVELLEYLVGVWFEPVSASVLLKRFDDDAIALVTAMLPTILIKPAFVTLCCQHLMGISDASDDIWRHLQ